MFSLAVEIIQFALAIGVTDITDIIMNTLGGFAGLAAYTALTRHTNDRYLDGGILVIGTLILVTILYLRTFVFVVRY
ncbi:MAG TPA: VanZ family protein [Pyrinomonadaceae bacterium]|nr:VanZ family protein [Pyrinomonadaceae bacterium]